jgi:hypothetical protein
MAKKHILTIGYRKYACDSVSAATEAVRILSKLKRVDHIMDGPYEDWHYVETGEGIEVELELNKTVKVKAPPKPEPKAKPLTLPKPKKGTIQCMCGNSYVAPKETCASCGLHFNVSHSRTHDSTPANTVPFRLTDH